MYRWDIINELIKKHNYKSYLEIGYYKGWSFDAVVCEEKMAVDPNPCKTEEQEKRPYGAYPSRIVKLTSDDFFNAIPESDKWDIIFIDGLHEASQVTRDIENSLRHLSDGGTIVLHDCNPPKYEHTTTGIDGCWTGDVYKAVIRVATDPTKHFYTVDTDWGVGVLQRRKGMHTNGRVGIERYLNDWSEFDKNREELLNLISKQDFIRMIKDVKPKNERAANTFSTT